MLGAFFGPVWAGAALAGYLLGAGEGALAAAVACVIIEALGIGLGRPTVGVVITGGPPAALLSFDHMPATMLSAAWLRESFAGISSASVNRVVAGMSGVTRPLALVVQPALWAAGALAAGLVRAEAERRRSSGLNLVAVVVGVSVLALGTVFVFSMTSIPVPWSTLALAFASSAAIAAAFVAGVGEGLPRCSSRRRPRWLDACPWRLKTPTSTNSFGSSQPPKTSSRASIRAPRWF